jgi:hypothetical protein
MISLNINQISKLGGLEGAKLVLRGGRPAVPGPPKDHPQYPQLGIDDLVLEAVGDHVVRVSAQEIQWVQQQIIGKNPPRSWGENSYRWRPKWKCPRCPRHAYVLHLRAGLFVCTGCAGPESRPERLDGAYRRLNRLRRLLGVTGIFDDVTASKPKDGPNAIARWRRRVRDLRLTEQEIGQRLEAEAFAKFVGCEKPVS